MFIILFSSNTSLSVLWPFCISILPRECFKEMMGSAALAQPLMAPGMPDLCSPTSCHCGHILVDMQPGRVELQGWPEPQDKSSPSGPGAEGVQDCLWGIKCQPWQPLPFLCGCHASTSFPPFPFLHSLCYGSFASKWGAHPTRLAPGLKLQKSGLGGVSRFLPLAEDSVKVTVKFVGKCAFSRLKVVSL
jgi:hypothetical protein